MKENATEKLKVDDLEPGDQLYSELGAVCWVTSVGKKRWVMMEDVNGDEKRVEHSLIENEDGDWMLASRAPNGEGLEV